ncbi:MAG: DNA-3-methyladenine glycosylase [Myxococcota bacterium]
MDAFDALPESFYQQDPHDLARAILGQDLVRQLDEETVLRARIVEVEVYGGIVDAASHSSSGTPTERTKPMFGDPGTVYVYRSYGIHHCMNVVAPSGERPAALLVRAARPLQGLDRMAKLRGLDDRYDEDMPRRVERNLASGPGKLCQALAVDLSFNFQTLYAGPLQLVRGLDSHADRNIERTPRIGLNPDTVGEAVDWPWRYVLKNSDFLSR